MPSNIAQVQDSATLLLQRLENVDIQAIAGNITSLLADARAQLGQGGDIQVLLADASQVMRSLRAAVETADLPAVAADARRAVASANALLSSRELQQTLAQGSAAMTELRNAAARLPASINQLEAGLRSARGATLDVQADLVPILRDLRAMTANLRDVTEALRRSPSQTLLGGPPPAPAGAPR